MNKNQTRNGLANLMRFRKPYKATDFLVSSNELRVKKDVYSLRKIKQLEIRFSAIPSVTKKNARLQQSKRSERASNNGPATLNAKAV